MGSMSIYIGNLSQDMTDIELKKIFMRFGQVSSATIMNDNYIGSGQARVYGFVEMPLKSEGEIAILGLNGRSYKGRSINVIEAMPVDTHPVKGISSRTRQRN